MKEEKLTREIALENGYSVAVSYWIEDGDIDVANPPGTIENMLLEYNKVVDSIQSNPNFVE